MCEAERIWIEEVEADALKRGESKGIKKGEATGMEKGLKKGREEGREEGLKKGREEEKREIVRSMIAQNLDDDIITCTTGMPMARIQAMRHEMQMI